MQVNIYFNSELYNLCIDYCFSGNFTTEMQPDLYRVPPSSKLSLHIFMKHLNAEIFTLPFGTKILKIDV